MPRYVALLRGVSPMNCSMPDLKRSLADVKTLLSSGNVAFAVARTAPSAVLKKHKWEALRESWARTS